MKAIVRTTSYNPAALGGRFVVIERTNLSNYGTIVIGGGPAALAFLLAARRSGALPALLKHGLRVVERTGQFGRREIGRYAIRSDSHSDSFVNAIRDSDVDVYSDAASVLERQRGSSTELEDVGTFLEDLAEILRLKIRDQAYDPVLLNTEVEKVERQGDGTWVTHTQPSKVGGHSSTFRSKCVVVATGGVQTDSALRSARVAGTPLFGRYARKMIGSADFLSAATQQRLAGETAIFRRVVVVGGSHSAIAAARVVIASESPCFKQAHVCVLHRTKLRITYQSREQALADGYDDFASDDICPRTGRVFALAGFRSESREFLRAQWSLGGMHPTGRVELVDLLSASAGEVDGALEGADIIVAAIGYRPRAVDVRDRNGFSIKLSSDTDKQPMVNGESRVLDQDGRPLQGLYAMGMAAGYPLAGMYGEPSFRGQANGWALWRTDIGEALSRSIVGEIQEWSR